jgi:c-di-GMP-related signal transduction protein
MCADAMAASNRDYSMELMGALRYLARQPILDLRGRVHGYELLYRDGPEAGFRVDGDQATRTMLDNTVVFGLENITGGSHAFVNCTLETLTGDAVHVLPPHLTFLEILESIEPSPDLIAACKKLKASGFRLALDDFVWAPKFAALVELADCIKVDFILTGAAERRDLLLRLKGKKLVLLAEKIETQEDYRQACAEGFTLFQGYYFCRPELIKNRKIPANFLCYVEILRLLRADPIDLYELSSAVRRDESLTYRLLRLVNSAGYGVRGDVTSVRSALMIMGEQTFRRVATLAIATELNTGRPSEILKMAMVRARFCELAAALGTSDPSEQYLLGMLSLLPAMIGMPMEELTPTLPLRKEVRDALEGIDNAEGRMLEWLKRHEDGDWTACEAIAKSSGVHAAQLNRCYTEAVLWAEDQFRLAD